MLGQRSIGHFGTFEQKTFSPTWRSHGNTLHARNKRLQGRQAGKAIPVIKSRMIEQLSIDAYLPSDVLTVILGAFEGPFDLILYLLRKAHKPILLINEADIIGQYMDYVHLIHELNIELAAEYWVMAATLIEIKSYDSQARRDDIYDGADFEYDPHLTLIQSLKVYEQFKKSAQGIDILPRKKRSVSVASIRVPQFDEKVTYPDVQTQTLVLAFATIIQRAGIFDSHAVEKDKFSTHECMAHISDTLKTSDEVLFNAFFSLQEGRAGIAVTFASILTLFKEGVLNVVQGRDDNDVYIKAKEIDKIVKN